MLTQAVDVLTVISNLFLLFPFIIAVQYRLIGRAFVYIASMTASIFYHTCDSYAVCIFDFGTLHNLDFFFAQLLIWLTALYFIHWSPKWSWLEWILGFLGGLFIYVLEVVLPGELYVQAGIAAVGFAVVVISWCISGVPKYEWTYVVIGLVLSGASIMLFSTQSAWPEAYWGNHSLWHASAALGQFYLLQIKAPPRRVKWQYQNVMGRVQWSRVSVE